MVSSWLIPPPSVFVLISVLRYIYPATFRKQMSNLWHVDISGDWTQGLSHDNSATSLSLASTTHVPRIRPIVQRIRSFVEHRTIPSTDRKTELYTDMSGVFNSLHLMSGELDEH